MIQVFKRKRKKKQKEEDVDDMEDVVVLEEIVITNPVEYVTLPNGKRIPRKNILKIDEVNNVIVYIDYDGQIKTATYTEKQQLGETRQETTTTNNEQQIYV